MRSGYSDDFDPQHNALWRGRVTSAMRGARGQRLLRDLLHELAVMPRKRLISEELVGDDGDVCLLGAGWRKRGIHDIAAIDPSDHETLAKRFDVAACLIQEIEYVNDEAAWKVETPEERYERVRRWLVENIKAAQPA